MKPLGREWKKVKDLDSDAWNAAGGDGFSAQWQKSSPLKDKVRGVALLLEEFPSDYDKLTKKLKEGFFPKGASAKQGGGVEFDQFKTIMDELKEFQKRRAELQQVLESVIDWAKS